MMKNTQPKALHKTAHHAAHRTPHQSEKKMTRKDDATAHIIRGLSLLMAHAQSNGLGTAARIIATAKEDVVHWAVDMNFHESAKDQYIHHHMFCPDAYAAAQLLTELHAMEDTPLRTSLLREFGSMTLKPTAKNS